jgi:hypothetical protein
MFGLVPGPDGEPRALFITDSAAVFQTVADHARDAGAVDRYPSPMPLEISCTPPEASALGEHLEATGYACVGLLGQTGYAILRTPSLRVRRVVVGSLAMAEWLHTQLGDRWHTYPSETVRALSGHYGWCFAVDVEGASFVDATLSLLGATPVAVAL